MKKINLYCIILLLFGLTVSCNKVQEEAGVEMIQEGNNVGLRIKEILPLPINLADHTAQVTSNINYKNLNPNISQSFIISHEDCSLRTICTPLNQKLKSSTEIYHVYFERDDLVSKFDLLITVENINKSAKTFTYLTREGELIAKFNVGIDNGLISNVHVNNLKSWGERFENCVNWTLENMRGMDKLVCMMASLACATTVASMCAIAASEEMFETTDEP
ncbi:MAG: hypothetical protein KKG99_06695 [Bacteroidetes bacterium]|nr:hypothetical protein [Bacteroidota bacterium]